METLFNPGTNVPISKNTNSSPMPVRFHTTYILAAITTIKEHIDKDPFKFKSSSDLLNYLNSPNRNLLEKAFRDVYGDGIKTYQVKARLNVAKALMMKGMPKKLVAHKCLYESSSSFTTAFKRQFGMTPSEWERTIDIKDLEDLQKDK
jgi:AraC-like DNA-binding protein